MPDDERSLAVPEPDVIRVSADDVVDASFDVCSDGQGFTDQECQAISPDGLHKCYADKPPSRDHEDGHYCCCGVEWPLEGEQAVYVDEIADVSREDWDKLMVRLGNLRTAEADAPDRYTDPHADDDMRRAIGRSIEHTEDPSLRRALLEAYHRS